MTSQPDTEVFVITLRAEPHDVPAILRLRAALKRLLRDYGLKCVSLAETQTRGDPCLEPGQSDLSHEPPPPVAASGPTVWL